MAQPEEKKKRNLLQRIIGWFADLFAWIKETLSDEEVRKAMLADLGLPTDSAPQLNLPQDSLDSIERYRKSENADEAAFLSAVNDIRKIIDAVKAFIKAAGVSEDAALEEVSNRFFQLMTLNYLRLRMPGLYYAGQAFGFIEESLTTHAPGKTYPERIVSFFKGVGEFFKGCGLDLDTEDDAKATSDPYLMTLGVLLTHLDNGLTRLFFGAERTHELHFIDDIYYGWENLALEPALADRVSDRALSVLLKTSENGTGEGSANCTLMFVPKEHGGPGVFTAFGGSGTVESQIDAWLLKFNLNSANAIDFLIGWDGAGFSANAAADAGAGFSLERKPPTPDEPFVVGIGNRTRLEFGKLAFSGDISSTGAGLKLLAENSALVISAEKDADTFVSEMMTKDETRIAFNLELGLSDSRGLYLGEGSGLSAIIPVGKTIGPVRIQRMQLGLLPDTAGGAARLALEATASLDVKIGGLTATIDQVGFRITLDFTKEDRNLGCADLTFGFKEPKGIGIAIDADAISGGGFLFLNPDKHEYGGVLELQIAEKISVKGIGVLSTKVPDIEGYSFVVLIFVEKFTPLQLGFGFAITGIGGLFAVNRTFDEAALRAGLKTHTLDSLMFPKDPVRNAPQIIGNINKVFPPAADHILFGPMLQIAWGTPPLITAEVALVFEFGLPFRLQRLLVLAQVEAILPKEDNDLVRLKMDAFGVIDFNQGTAALDATLYDSRLVKKFVLTGDMAMRLKWKSPQNFALAVGGFHHAFNPPPNFPKLARVAINLSSGNNPRLLCEAYFAITPNTLQFGARAELFASARGFSVQGHIGFDVLLQRQPFYFIAEFSAQVQLKKGDFNLFKVSVEGALSGPRPLNIRGKATFEILWWDISIKFDTTLIEGEKPEPAVPVEVLPLLKEALTSPANWVAALPPGRQQMVTLQPRAARDKEVVLHPLGSLTVKQTVVPLNTDITRFGSAVPSGPNRFTVTSADPGTSSTQVTDYFAPAQFFEMSDDEKLSSPSFESRPAGIKFGSEAFSFPADDLLETAQIDFETYRMVFEGNKAHLVTEDANGARYTLTDKMFANQYSFGAAGSSKLNRTARAKRSTKFRKYVLVDEEWTIVDAGVAVLSDQTIDQSGGTTYMDARNTIRQNGSASALKVVRLSELDAGE